MALISDQGDVNPITPMPCDRVDDTSVVNSSSAEAVVWYYSNSGVWAAASGQAAGTMCYAKLTYSGVTNALGSAIGNYYDTSLSFAAATRAATLVEVPEAIFSKMERWSVANKVIEIAKHLTTAGEYAVDHRRGAVWLMTKADPTNDEATYSYQTPLTGGGAGDKVDVIKLGGTAIAIDESAMAATPPVLPVAGEYRAAATTYTDGDASVLQTDINGRLKVNLEGEGNAPQAYGQDAAGADAYTTVVTAGADRHHVSISVEGSNPAIVSVDSGTTDHYWIPANTTWVFDNILIASGATVQGKNGTGGSNYTNLSISVW